MEDGSFRVAPELSKAFAASPYAKCRRSPGYDGLWSTLSLGVKVGGGVHTTCEYALGIVLVLVNVIAMLPMLLF
jgi:hypothetical protein